MSAIKVSAIALMTGCVLGVAACSSKPEDPQTQSGSSPQGQGSGYASAPTPTPAPPLPFGQPFDFRQTYQTGPGTAWKVTLSQVECGLKSIPKADQNPNWDGSTDKPEYVEATPSPGNEFCITHWDWQNAGTQPDTTTHAGNLWVGEEQYAQSSEDASRSWTILKTHLNVDYSSQVNPRSSTKSLDVYQLPVGSQPTKVTFPMTTIDGPGWLQIATR